MKHDILFISSEAFPLIKTGGLADVAGSLPIALQHNGQRVRLLLPAYQSILQQLETHQVVARARHYDFDIEILQTTLPGSDIVTWLVHCPSLFDRPGNPYLDAQGEPWADNALRFALFSQVAVDIALNRIGLDWHPDLVHCNDWQSALVPALLDTFLKRPATLFTIHNLAYQGLFDDKVFFDLGLPGGLWGMYGLEFHGNFSFIKGGLVYADRINTVSPTYAQEIQQPEFGYGLDGLLRHRSERLSGILNGIDTRVWNPATDPQLAVKYDMQSLDKKTGNKTALQQQLGLPVDAKLPMIGMISRLVEQKGLPTILGAMAGLLDMPLQLVILGSGDKTYEQALQTWADQQPDKLRVIIGYDEKRSHQIEAAADMYLMPSMFEPCGLNQLYSLRYGNLPVARNVGGLADSVIDARAENIANHTANGFIVEADNAEALLKTLNRALAAYQDQTLWRQLQINAMTPDRSWQASAKEYIKLYDLAIADNR
jgi:starch synthase